MELRVGSINDIAGEQTNSDSDVFEEDVSPTEDGGEIASEAEEDSIPPFEMALQSVLGPALDTTVWRLRGLHESQVDLTAQLNILTTILESYRTETQPLQLKITIAKINACRQKLHSINNTLGAVEERLFRVKRRLKDSGDFNNGNNDNTNNNNGVL